MERTYQGMLYSSGRLCRRLLVQIQFSASVDTGLPPETHLSNGRAAPWAGSTPFRTALDRVDDKTRFCVA